MQIHKSISKGLSLWLDFSATPKDQNGTYFPWIICDYPLAQAVEDRIIKAPLIVHKVKDDDPDEVTRENVTDKYCDWLIASLERWREHYKTYKELGLKPVLFIMAEKNAFADKIGVWLFDKTNNTGLRKNEVLVIHTDSEGEITKKDLEKAREAARDIDKPENKIKVIVSVLMLREGWDVKNVSVVLGLRPFTSKAKILPEQAVGRGLRLMQGISWDRTQTLEVIGTKAFEDFVKQLELEGLGIKTTTTPPEPPVIIAPVKEKVEFDIAIPLTHPVYSHDYKRISNIDPLKLDSIFEPEKWKEENKLVLKMQFATTETEIHTTHIPLRALTSQEVLSQMTNKTAREAKLPTIFSELYPLVRTYVTEVCFGEKIDIEKEEIRRYLGALLVQESIARYLASKIGELTAEKREIKFENARFRLSETKKFIWRRKHLQCKQTIFNYVATYNDFESSFAKFLDNCKDILSFAALAEHFTRFRVDYLSLSGAIKFYYPDFVAIQKTDRGKHIHWIIETKGRVYENLPYKEASIKEWCKKVSDQVEEDWQYVRIDQAIFESNNYVDFASIVNAIFHPEEGKLYK
jgi:type III restriction enzyme